MSAAPGIIVGVDGSDSAARALDWVPGVQLVDVEPVALQRLAPLLGPQRYEALWALAERTVDGLRGHTVWNVSSTATGGGVAELLKVLVAYGLGAGVSTRWLVIAGDPSFFEITKRIHNRLHGAVGDEGDLGRAERDHYLSVLESNVAQLRELVRPGDVVILHDPQTAGLAAALSEHGALVVWRCHVGIDTTNRQTDQAWAFLRSLCQPARELVFSRAQYAPDWVDPGRLTVIAPTIDPFAVKNVPMSADVVRSVLARVGILGTAGATETTLPRFQRADGTPATVSRPATVLREGPGPSADVPLVVQVSRWDRLKDMAGVLEGFVRHVLPAVEDVQLVLAGPDVAGVTDDPEGQQVLAECAALWRSLPVDQRRRVSLVALDTQDVEENAAVVNALQSHAAVVTQKSLAEGFGLTVAEAMWKSRPVVASGVGGILDQVTSGEQGLLVADPTDLAEFGAAVSWLLTHPVEAGRLGAAARARVLERFLPDRELIEWAQVLRRTWEY